MKPLSLSIVSYYNTIPLVYGIENALPQELVNVVKDNPAGCARQLIDGTVHLGLVPVGALLSLPAFHQVGNYCIGTVGKVLTVNLYSQCPIDQITEVFLDHDSRTSNLLVQVIAREFLHLSPRFIQPTLGYEQRIQGTTAGLIIGNRAFTYHHKFAYCYDLGELWNQHTGLPFVFATWASLHQVDTRFVDLFDKAQAYGVSHTREAIQSQNQTYDFDIYSYLTQNISFELDDKKREAMSLFGELCGRVIPA